MFGKGRKEGKGGKGEGYQRLEACLEIEKISVFAPRWEEGVPGYLNLNFRSFFVSSEPSERNF